MYIVYYICKYVQESSANFTQPFFNTISDRIPDAVAVKEKSPESKVVLPRTKPGLKWKVNGSTINSMRSQ